MHQELNGLRPANTPAIAVIRKPGGTWHYSPAGFTVVQALMDIYNQDFASIMQQLVLAPLGMSDSTFVQPLPENLVPRSAVPYLPDGHRLPNGPLVFNTAGQLLEETLRLNTLSHLDIAHYFGRKLAERRRGGLILVGAMGAENGIPRITNDGAAKAYVHSLGEALHYEFKPLGVYVT